LCRRGSRVNRSACGGRRSTGGCGSGRRWRNNRYKPFLQLEGQDTRGGREVPRVALVLLEELVQQREGCRVLSHLVGIERYLIERPDVSIRVVRVIFPEGRVVSNGKSIVPFVGGILRPLENFRRAEVRRDCLGLRRAALQGDGQA